MLEILERGEILCFTVKRDGLLSIFRPKKLLRNGSFVLFVCFTVFHVYSSCALLLQVSDNPSRSMGSAITLGSLKLIVFIASISTHSGHWRLHIFESMACYIRGPVIECVTNLMCIYLFGSLLRYQSSSVPSFCLFKTSIGLPCI